MLNVKFQLTAIDPNHTPTIREFIHDLIEISLEGFG